MILWLKSLTIRERLFASLAGFSTMLFAGHVVADLLERDIKWGDFGAMGACIVAAFALMVGVLGYLDNRKAQRLEYRAYLRFDVVRVSEAPNGCLRISFEISNYGRTPARNVKITGNCEVLWHEEMLQGVKDIRFALDAVHPSALTNVTSLTLGGFPPESMDYVEQEKSIIQITAAVSYDDEYARQWTDRFQFVCRGGSKVDGFNHYIKVLSE